jgi:phage terminase large subunit-like protein
MSSCNLALLTSSEKLELLSILEEQERRKSRRKIDTYYPDDGPLRRELYPKHTAFFEAGAEHRERLMLAANRVGKSEGIGGYETALHLTGEYPDWWVGRRFLKAPIRAWCAGKTNETTRDIVQNKLFGPISFAGARKSLAGSGLIPGDALGDISWKQGVNDLVDTVRVKHKPTGQWSVVGLKSYQQGRGSFEGTEQDVVWLDEEPPLEIYTECLIRTMTTSGLMILTFTPLEGMSEVVMSFLDGGKLPK